MSILRKSWCALSFGALLAAVAVPGMAQIKERSLKFGHFSTAESSYGKGAYRFADIIKEKSGGKIVVTIYNSAQLGNEVQEIGATQAGLQDFFLISSSPLTSLVKKFQVLDFPGLMTDRRTAYGLLDGPIGQEMLADFGEKKLKGLGYWENGFRAFTNSKRPVRSLADFQGLKVRVIQNPIYIDMFSQLGTHAVAMPFNELYTALETHIVDAQDNAMATNDMARFYEVQKYLSITNHVYNAMVLAMSKKTWDDMSAEEQRIITDAATEAGKYQRQLSEQLESQQIENWKHKGGEVYVFTPQQQEELKRRMAPAIDKYRSQVGEAFVDKVYKEVERLKQSK